MCEYGHCACSGQRRSVHLELDRQWGRWGHIGTATCSVWFPAVSTRGARGILRCVSSDGDVCLSFGLIRPRRAAVSGCQAALDTTIVAPPPRSTHLTFSTSLKLPSARTHARARTRLVEVAPPSRAREKALLAKWRASGARLTLTRRSQSRGRLPPSRKMPSRKMPRSGLRTATSCVGCGETSCGPSSWAQLRRLAVCSVCHACAAPINRPRAADTLLPRSQATRFGICAPSAAERWCCS